MHRSETRELATCALCGAEIAPASDRSFAAGGDAFLCFQCALERGGRYDELHDRWETAPETAGLPLAED
jgi:hypothetical protein